jgi:hypothetical protein
LTELCRLTIERYRQDTILPELFGSKLRDTEAELWKSWHKDEDQNAYDFFAAEEHWALLKPVAEQLTNRIRKDTRVLLHIRGPQDSRINTIRDIFNRRSSFLNRLMTFLLYRCGAYSVSFDELKRAAHAHGAPRKNVICRYGADTMNHILQLFTDADQIEETLALVQYKQQQSPARHWVPGTFPPSLARGG